MTTQDTMERFEKTQLVTKAGCWLECSDYEGTVEEMRAFLRSEISLAVQAEREHLLNQRANQHDEEVRRLYREALAEKVEGMTKEAIVTSAGYVVGYNNALQDLLQELKSKEN